ncbi:hypothetical protein OKA05_28595 [Luteolibacter arcticus]|uniref:Response regulator receiver protein n=1 Tax=Luteolibacter arcticus TaxID=1581411 RepID=A0ABT3GSQ0_9BACT|nr:hypothetical protein [Luteolibacter arcticus]MCW1926545.1 hypothetical protein [Luteolibacter arcticus]
MRRVLIVDDQDPAFAGELETEIRDESGNAPELMHINPSDFFSDGRTPDQTLAKLLARVAEAATEFWDVIIIDLYLGDFGFDGHRNLEVCLRVAEAAREANRSATMLLYSGTLSKYVNELLGGGASDTQLRRIFHAEVANFVQRSRIAREVRSAVDNPTWLLRVDRLLMTTPALVVGPEEAEFVGRTFAELAKLVRRQNDEGQKITQLAVDYGVAAFTDLNS